MNSQDLNKASHDLGYVRNLVEQSDSTHSPPLLYFLWAVIFLAVPLIAEGSITASSFGKLVTLILALGYFLAGLHLERSFGWVSLAMLLGYAVLLLAPAFSWTITGVLVAPAMTAAGLGVGRHAAIEN